MNCVPVVASVRLRRRLAACLVSLLVAIPASAKVILVGRDGVETLGEAAELARDGDVVEVRAGEYQGGVAVWGQKSLKIRAVGGRAVVIAHGNAAQGKGIWVLQDGSFEVEGFDFVGARVPDGNGAGIRLERGSLVVRNSRFLDNQMGILTGNDAASELRVEHCEFRGPRDGNHWYHNLYVGRIARFTMRDSWSHDARSGHLVKSRARENLVIGNRLVNGAGSAATNSSFQRAERRLSRGPDQAGRIDAKPP